MYYIYLYSNNEHKRSSNQYGYWTRKSYIVQGGEYPACEDPTSKYKRKEYKNLKRAISSGETAMKKYGYVRGFDVEDEKENVVYESQGSHSNEKNNRFAWNDVIHELNQMNNGTENRKRTIQVAVKYIEEVPEELSDSEIDEYLKSKYPDKEFQWCDDDQDVFGDF